MVLKIFLFLSLLCNISAGEVNKAYNLKWVCQGAKDGTVDLGALLNIALVRIRNQNATSSKRFDNLALKKKVLGSTVFRPKVMKPGNMVDGKENMHTELAALGRCTWAATLYIDANPMWLIDLGVMCQVHGIGLIHLTTYGTPHDTLIEVFSSNPKGNLIVKGRECIRLSGYLQYKLEVSCHRPIIGRYVRLKKVKTDYDTDTFAFCEIHVYGSLVPKAKQRNESARVSLSASDTQSKTVVETDVKRETFIAANKPGLTIATNKPGPTIATNKAGPTIATNKLGPTIAKNKPGLTIATNKPGPTITTNKPGPTIATNKPRPTIATNKPGPTIAANKPGPSTHVPPVSDMDTVTSETTPFVPRTMKEMFSCTKQFKKSTALHEEVHAIGSPSCYCTCLSLRSGVPQRIELMFEKLMVGCSFTK